MRARAVIASGAAHVVLAVLALRAARPSSPPRPPEERTVRVEVVASRPPSPTEAVRGPAPGAAGAPVRAAPAGARRASSSLRTARTAPRADAPAPPAGAEPAATTGESDGGAAAGDGGAAAGSGGGEGAGGAGWAAAGRAELDLAKLEIPPPAPPPSRARPPVLIFPARQVKDTGDEPWLARLKIDEEGFVVGSQLLRGPPGAVADAVWRFRYRPALDDVGRPVAAVVDQPFLTDQ